MEAVDDGDEEVCAHGSGDLGNNSSKDERIASLREDLDATVGECEETKEKLSELEEELHKEQDRYDRDVGLAEQEAADLKAGFSTSKG